jgi:hypothetical protein
VPDLAGCLAAPEAEAEKRRLIAEAIGFISTSCAMMDYEAQSPAAYG